MAKTNDVLLLETVTTRANSNLGGAKLTLEGTDLADTVEDTLSDYSDGYKATSVVKIGNEDIQQLRARETWGYCLTKKDQVEDDKVGAACHLLRGEDPSSNDTKYATSLAKHGQGLVVIPWSAWDQTAGKDIAAKYIGLDANGDCASGTCTKVSAKTDWKGKATKDAEILITNKTTAGTGTSQVKIESRANKNDFPKNSSGTISWYQPKSGTDMEEATHYNLGRYAAGDIVFAWVVSTCGVANIADKFCNTINAYDASTCAPKSGTAAAYKSAAGYQIPKSADDADPVTELGELQGAAALAAGTTAALLALAL